MFLVDIYHIKFHKLINFFQIGGTFFFYLINQTIKLPCSYSTNTCNRWGLNFFMVKKKVSVEFTCNKPDSKIGGFTIAHLSPMLLLEYDLFIITML